MDYSQHFDPIRALQASVPAHVWLSGEKSEGVVSSDKKSMADFSARNGCVIERLGPQDLRPTLAGRHSGFRSPSAVLCQTLIQAAVFFFPVAGPAGIAAPEFSPSRASDSSSSSAA